MKIKKFLNSVYFPWSIPLLLVLIYHFVKSLDFPLHDFSNGYFSAYALSYLKNIEFIWDIFEFNTYIWDLDYPEVLVDFYINTPFTISFFYPFTFFQDAYAAKAIFNLLGISVFLMSLKMLLNIYSNGTIRKYLLLLFPVLFFVPLRNQILFGQSYFYVFACIVFSLVFLEKNRGKIAAFFLVLAALLKIFPVIYGSIFLIQRKYRSIFLVMVFGVILILMSLFIIDFNIWELYLFQVLPETIKNQSSVGFQFNAQSFSVFIKTLFVHDDFYNPMAVFNSFGGYVILLWLFKSIILGFSIRASLDNRQDNYAQFAIWTVSLLLIQDRTATYTQLLWIIPFIYIFSKPIKIKCKVFVSASLLVLCNIPLNWLEPLPIVLRFGRMWLSIVLGIIFFLFLIKGNTLKTQLLTLIVISPLCILSIINYDRPQAKYVLDNKGYFMVFDYGVENGKLYYEALGKEGRVKEETGILVHSFEDNTVKIIDNQLFYKGKQITNEKSLKANPVLVDNKEVYFLSDYNSRRMHYALRKVSIE
ncbi:glycosyltransferase family 87 protein [Aestuariivivens sediminicola]|uniref:glycosyltransferase family 87 protein n=1 Tax=Aestuariivivens sediminicola TaxID=2913560 RepID=UPI001F567463|nr:glycosyltransferase family 87 protein [Aestuariivivens sediminicola]